MAATFRLFFLPMMIGNLVIDEFSRFVAASMAWPPPRARSSRD